MKSKIFTHITVILLFIISFSVLSCRSTTDNVEGEGQTTVKINLLGITEAMDAPIKQASAVKTEGIQIAYVMEVPYNKDYNIVATITPETSSVKLMLRLLLILRHGQRRRKHQVLILLQPM